ncbi:MAG: diacylglycerol/lipid kinase family protein [Coriobacteriales bacterium]
MNLGKTLLIVNPTAKSGEGETAARTAEELLRKQLPDGPDVVRTSAAGHGRQLAAQLAERYQTVVALGGDGIAHEVVNGLMELDAAARPVFGLIPVGSGNDYARSLGVSFKVPQAVRQLLDYEARLTDLGMVNGEYFMETLSFGLDAAIALGTMERRKKDGKSGTLLYFEEGIHQFLHHLDFYPYELSTVDEGGAMSLRQGGSAILVAVQLGPTYGGGFMICPKARLDDGLLDVCVANGPISALRAIKVFLSAKGGHHVGHPAITLSRAQEAVLRFEGTPQCQIDGEAFSAPEYRIRVVPNALRVIRS